MMITICSLFLLVTFVACGFTFPTEDINDIFSSTITYGGNEENFLGDKILNGVNSSVHFCNDPYTALCGKDVKYAKPSYLKQSYQHIREHLVNLLSRPVNLKHEVRALSLEKILFHKCMTLGSKNDTEGMFETINFVSDLFQEVLDSNHVWQNIDDHLNVLGLGFTFFDIGVERDPENPHQNVIILQPPSYSQIQDIHELITIAFEATNYQHISKSLAWRFYHSVNHDAVQKFFEQWLKVFLRTITQRAHANVKNAKMTISQWNDEYNTRALHRITSKIDWEKLIIDTFARVNIPVTGRENIIVKNEDYFLYLTDVLGSVRNNVIVGAIKSKVIADNLRYIDWKNAELLEDHKKKSMFCFEDTKLYGASFRLLRDLKKEDSNNVPNYKILKVMLRNIACVTESAIADSNNLSSKEKTFLKSQVKLITSDIINHNKYRSIVDNIYQNYKISPSYFVSILRYRKMLKEKELKSLQKNLTYLVDPVPFSITDLAKPRNRFILNVFANSFVLSKKLIPSRIQREVHYGIYGVKIASFLYGLLNENRLYDRVIVDRGKVDWYDHPNYPVKSLKCFVGNDLGLFGKNLATETVTQIYGAHIAYKAMLKEYLDSGVSRQENYVSNPAVSYTADQLFFMAYGKYHCELSKKVLNTVLSNLNEYNVAFDCYSNEVQPTCSLKGFEIQEKRHFLNRPL